jgi:HTH-type transcriptional regulator/antitoxin HigA
METLVYKIIKTKSQYHKYCDRLELLLDLSKKSKDVIEQIELLHLLIDKYDEEHNSFDDLNPIELLKALMKENNMKAVELSTLLNVSEGLVSDMLNFKKGLSKETIRILSERFKMNQAAFNRPYELSLSSTIISKGSKRVSKRKNFAIA